MTGDSSWYLKIMTAHLQKWGAREGSYETGVQSARQEGLRLGPGGGAGPALPFARSLTRRKSFPSLDCLPSPCKNRNLVGRRPEPEIFPSPWLKFFFRVALGLPFIMGRYWEILHLGYLSVILPDTPLSIVRKEKNANISCLETISFRRAGAVFWPCMERKTSGPDVRTHVPSPPLTGWESWVWSHRQIHR